ncbi:MAG: hypothetical protein AABY01_04735 [Nanoarchaeota archaeon]
MTLEEKTFLPEWNPDPYPSFEDLRKERDVWYASWEEQVKQEEKAVWPFVMTGIPCVATLYVTVDHLIPLNNLSLTTLAVSATIATATIFQHFARTYIRTYAQEIKDYLHYLNTDREVQHCFERLTSPEFPDESRNL